MNKKFSVKTLRLKVGTEIDDDSEMSECSDRSDLDVTIEAKPGLH